MNGHARTKGFDRAEIYQSQTPAIQTLVALGFKLLTGEWSVNVEIERQAVS